MDKIKRATGLILLGVLLSCFLFAAFALSASSPGWLRMVALEIQAACRDAETQWMVTICLLSYFVAFVVIEAKSKVQRPTSNVADQETELSTSNFQHSTSTDKVSPSVTFHLPSAILSPNLWLAVFVSLVLLRYAVDYTNASKSLQVVVLLTGIVIGKAMGFFAGRKSKNTSSGCATFSPSDAEKGSGAHGVTRPTINNQPSTLNIARHVLCILALLLACAALWQPDRGMEFFYRGVKRWTGPWDNPNLFGLLMGVGTTLAFGLLILGKRPTSNVQHSTPDWRQSAIRYAECLLFLAAAGLCAFGLVKSFSRGAWLGTAAGIGLMLFQVVKFQVSRSEHAETKKADSRKLLADSLPPLLILLFSIFIISFWQFRHTEQPVMRRAFSAGNVNDFSWRNRVATWGGAAQMMADRPLAGHGWVKAEQVFRETYKPARLEDSAAIQMNDYLMLGISCGVPALVCFGLYLARAACGVWREQTERHPLHRQICFAGALVLLIGFWFDGGLFKLPTCVVFWVLLELARAEKEERGIKNDEDGVKTEGCGEARHSVCADPGQATSGAHGVTRPAFALRLLAGIALVWATGLTTLHLGVPQLPVSERTLTLARRHLIQAAEREDFDFLAAKPIWSGEKLRTLLTHVHLAHYNRGLVNWKLDDATYREFVLSPEMSETGIPAPGRSTTLSPSDGGKGGPSLSTLNHQLSTDCNWRRELWEYFYPRVRRDSEMTAAADAVTRHLGERFRRVDGGKGGPKRTIVEVWQAEKPEVTSVEMETLTVAAFRSAGIPARLNHSMQAEHWNGKEWQLPASRR